MFRSGGERGLVERMRCSASRAVRALRFLQLVALGALAACASTSHDGREAYWAAFAGEIPADVSVVKAELWENRHLLVFAEYWSALELQVSDEALRRLMAGTGRQFEPFDPNTYGLSGPTVPAWFAPKDGRRYEGWRSTPDDELYLIREVGSKRVFVHRSRL